MQRKDIVAQLITEDARIELDIKKQELDQKEKNIEIQNAYLQFLYEEVQTQNDDLSKKNAEIERQHEAIKVQNDILKNTYKELTDSLTYAKRIQKALTGSPESFKLLFSDAFILLSPKHIVSGDFYWFSGEKGGMKIVIAADCTGHGVPGALMTMLGSVLLDEIVNDFDIQSPEVILTLLDDKLRTLLSKQDDSIHDGMDIGILIFGLEPNEALFAGAKNSLIQIRNQQYDVIKGDILPLGGSLIYQREKHFTLHQVSLEPGDCLYMVTDGFADQYGGSEDKKFMTTPFRKILAQNSTLPMDEQRTLLRSALDDWRGAAPQTDDILVIGMKV